MDAGLDTWFFGIPRITRATVLAMLIINLCVRFNAIQQSVLLLDWMQVLHKYHIWRLFSSCLYIGPFSLRWVMFISMVVQFSGTLERDNIFASSAGSYLYFLLLQMASVCAISALAYYPNGYPLLGDALLSAIIYYWSKRDAWSNVSVYFFTVKAYQLPIVLVGFHLLTGTSIVLDLIGIASGHLYYLVREVLPSKGFPNILGVTPRPLDKLALLLANMVDFGLGSFRSSNIGPGFGSRINGTYYRPRPAPPTPSTFVGQGRRLNE